MKDHGFIYKIFSLFVGLSGLQAYGFIFGVLFLCGIGLPVPEDLTLIAAGYLSGEGSISFVGALLVGFIGVLAGDILLFTIGYRFGDQVFKWPIFVKVFTPPRIQKAKYRINKNAKLICFTARFAPGLRAAIYLTAGTLKVPFKVFIFQDGLAALASVPFWVWTGYKFHEHREKALEVLTQVHIYLFIFVAFIFSYLLWKWIYKDKKSV